MSKPKVFLTRDIGPDAIDRLNQLVDSEVWPEKTPPTKQEIINHIDGALAIITMLTDPIDRDVIDNAQNLQLISQMAVGYDNIDLHYATSKHIPVGHTPDVLTETTADFTWALLMATARRVVESHNEVQNGIWKPWGPFVWTGTDVFGKTLGIIGLGRIGQAVARRAKGFNMKVLYNSRDRKPDVEKELNLEYVSLSDLLKRSDFVSLNTSLTKETYHLIDKKAINQMKPGAFLINTARGTIVDQEALYQALKEQKIAGAGLDVTDPEPIRPDDPILRLPNVVITPHIGSSSLKTRERMAMMMVENVEAILNHQTIPYCANPEVYADFE